MGANADTALGMLFVVLAALAASWSAFLIVALIRRYRDLSWQRHVAQAMQQSNDADFDQWEAEYRTGGHV